MVCGRAVLADTYTIPLNNGHESGRPLPSFIPFLIPILTAGPDKGLNFYYNCKGRSLELFKQGGGLK